jgi:two-component system response regulator RegA
MAQIEAVVAELPDRSLMLLDDDQGQRDALARQLHARGFEVTATGRVSDAMAMVRDAPPAFAVMDLRLSDGSGLDVCGALHRMRRTARSVMLSGYGDIATAVAAVKLGAADYLLKPADPGDLVRSLLGLSDARPEPSEVAMSPGRKRWEHIQRVFDGCGQNRSETARLLSMHRRTLQRILTRGAPA